MFVTFHPFFITVNIVQYSCEQVVHFACTLWLRFV